jgi:hypothetical protein
LPGNLKFGDHTQRLVAHLFLGKANINDLADKDRDRRRFCLIYEPFDALVAVRQDARTRHSGVDRK